MNCNTTAAYYHCYDDEMTIVWRGLAILRDDSLSPACNSSVGGI